MSKVIVVGSVNVDLTIKLPTLPSVGETVIGGTFVQAAGGKGGNQAAAAARLGAETWIVAAVGRDAFGDAARRDLTSAGVHLSELTAGERHTGVAEILVDDSGENLIGVASGANDELSAAMVEESLARLPVEGAVVLSVLEVADEAVAAAARVAARRGARFVLNPAPARPVPDEVVRACDALTPNQYEAAALGSADDLLRRGASAVVVTRGAAGADLVRPGRDVYHQRPYQVDVVDTTGAGDAFSATLAWALAEGRSLEQAVGLASAGGALSTRSVGARAGLATAAEIEALQGRAVPARPTTSRPASR
jgi:ribokinase